MGNWYQLQGRSISINFKRTLSLQLTRKETLMAQESKHVGNHAASSFAGVLWFIGWLFTIGYANLIWWKIILALIVWPYYLGLAIR
jgi:hypothetical protein